MRELIYEEILSCHSDIVQFSPKKILHMPPPQIAEIFEPKITKMKKIEKNPPR